jgi:GPH family glycoside/pentoside/hexuronide:cation symporter
MGIYLSSWLAIQVTATVLKYYVVSWMGLPDSLFFMAALAVQGTALVMLSAWSQVSYRLGKKAVYYLGAGFWLITELGLFLLQPGQIGFMFFLCIIAGFGVSVGYLIPWSMLPDVIDLDELKTGQRREGVFYSFMLVLQKMGLALGLALVGQILEWSGYQSTIAGSTAPIQPDSALLAIRLSITLLPLFCVILGVVLAYFYPITQAVHQEILLKLEQNRELAKHQPPL